MKYQDEIGNTYREPDAVQPVVDFDYRNLANRIETECKEMEFQSHCMIRRQAELKRLVDDVRVAGLSFYDYCELQAAIAIGQTMRTMYYNIRYNLIRNR